MFAGGGSATWLTSVEKKGGKGGKGGKGETRTSAQIYSPVPYHKERVTRTIVIGPRGNWVGVEGALARAGVGGVVVVEGYATLDHRNGIDRGGKG